MSADKNSEKIFCPFCGRAFSGNYKDCPFCGQDIRQYKDDLGPVLGKIQTATNIDMKSTKVRVTMAAVMFVLVFVGALVVFDYYEATRAEDPAPPVPEGIIVDLGGNEYLDLMGDFVTQKLSLTPRTESDLTLDISISEDHRGDFTKVIWMVRTDTYNSNPQTPFFLKVTKEASDGVDVCTVTWNDVTMGAFEVIAECFTEDGESTVFTGNGVHYGKLATSYAWTYGETAYTFDYEMSSADVRECLDVDLKERLKAQSVSSMEDYINDGAAVSDIESKLRSLFYKVRYTESGYAEFVLSFVQSCFPLEYDSYNYRTEDYWAYPTETLLNGCGDDEDRAILFCSIMRAAGFGTGIVHLPGTVMAAVSVDLSDSFIQTYAKTQTSGGKQYTVADTGSDLGLGLMRERYDVDNRGRLTYDGDVLGREYGLVTA